MGLGWLAPARLGMAGLGSARSGAVGYASLRYGEVGWGPGEAMQGEAWIKERSDGTRMYLY